ncbi:MAG: GNAT family N-acetyltransferase [Pedobacter sp.]|nr:GNAT family N-acetyltransferase [Pedobacter sp.]MDQ8054312.1 GNAT family N-acetyltransferase [Pedobacter sp.]
MNIQIQQSTPTDLELIFEFYGYAVAHQKEVSDQHWEGFDPVLVKQEIAEGRQYQVLVDGQVACVFVVTFNDKQIWKERSNDPAIYVHRIVTHPSYRGLGFVGHITDWAIGYAKQHALQFVRLDTWADNEKLNQYYQRFGFQPAGNILITANSGLPKHYEGIELSLFEIGV